MSDNGLDPKQVISYIESSWKKDVENTLIKYIEIPNQSPDYDAKIHENGYQEKAYKLLKDWALAQNVSGLTLEVLHDKNRTPLIYIEVEANNKKLSSTTVLMYGHFDKQPPLTSDWDKDLHPYKGIIKNGKLYGRGGADDGYAIFAAINSIKVLQKENKPHPRCCIIIEGSEESGSPDLLYYIDKLKNKIKIPKVVICLDSGCQNYEQLWMTVSLRGIIIAYLKTQLLTEGIHSGDSGIIRDSFHVLRLILDRIDNAKSGEMLKELYVDIPESHIKYAKDCAKCLKENVYKKIPFYNELCLPQIEESKNDDDDNLYKLILNRTWKPQLTITGIDGIPDLKGGNVLRKYTTIKMSVRIPPSMDPLKAQKALKNLCEKKPTPFNANVECQISSHAGQGFVCPEYENWLLKSIHYSSKTYFNKEAQFTGEGGSIPFMGQLQKKFPKSQFVITGILGPNSNAHGPNEFLHIDFTKKVMCCISNILFDIGQKSLNDNAHEQKDDQ